MHFWKAAVLLEGGVGCVIGAMLFRWLHRVLVRVANEYGPPAIYVTENGASFGDIRGHDGRVHDPERSAAFYAVLAAKGPCDRACALLWHEDWLILEDA